MELLLVSFSLLLAPTKGLFSNYPSYRIMISFCNHFCTLLTTTKLWFQFIVFCHPRQFNEITISLLFFLAPLDTTELWFHCYFFHNTTKFRLFGVTKKLTTNSWFHYTIFLIEKIYIKYIWCHFIDWTLQHFNNWLNTSFYDMHWLNITFLYAY